MLRGCTAGKKSFSHVSRSSCYGSTPEDTCPIFINNLDQVVRHAYHKATLDLRDAKIHEVQPFLLSHFWLPVRIQQAVDEEARIAMGPLIKLLHGRQVVNEVQRRSSIVIVSAQQHVHDCHSFAQILRLVASHVVGGCMRRQLHPELQSVEVHVLLEVLGLLHRVSRVPSQGQQLVRVELHDLVLLLLEDHDAPARILVSAHHRIPLADERNQRVLP
mmetsp:Transcript_42008/g.104524  ORF Transcript_42008/g.104524 Transcript_42008/m.104524 type:complete len:217 (-) Transcript_42008:64-714(-)